MTSQKWSGLGLHPGIGLFIQYSYSHPLLVFQVLHASLLVLHLSPSLPLFSSFYANKQDLDSYNRVQQPRLSI